jgi:hypothetical protein
MGRYHRKTLTAEAVRRLVIELACREPGEFGVRCGCNHSQSGWTIAALHRYVRSKHACNVSAERFRDWLKAPELAGKVKLWRPKRKVEPPKRLSAAAKGQLNAGKPKLNGFGSRGDDDVTRAKPVTLPMVYFQQRPEIPPTARERLGGDYRPPPIPAKPQKRPDDEVLAEGKPLLGAFVVRRPCRIG